MRVHCWFTVSLLSTKVLFCRATFQFGLLQPKLQREIVLPFNKLWVSFLPISAAYPAPTKLAAYPSSVSPIPLVFYVIWKLAEGILCPITQINNEDVELYLPQYQPSRYTKSNLPLTRLGASDQQFSQFSFHLIIHLPNPCSVGLLVVMIKLMSVKAVVWMCVYSFLNLSGMTEN